MSFKRKTCKHCRKKLEPERPGQIVHTECAADYAIALNAKKARAKAKEVRKADRVRKEKLKSRADWMKDAQKAVNAYVRARDANEPCISCGRYHQGEWHAGHYLSRGAHPELALDPRNIAKQCQPCNVHLSGNQINFRKGLIARHGVEFVEWLDGAHEPKKYTIQDLLQIRDKYRHKLKEMKKSDER